MNVTDTSAKRKFDLVDKTAEVKEAMIPKGFELLPDELLFSIIWKSFTSIESLEPLSKVCVRWRVLLQDKEIYKNIIQQKFPHLMTEKYESGDYFAKAFSFANKLKKIAREFKDSKRNLLTYNSYKRKINEAFTSSQSMMGSLPYFDLRPIAWLEPKDWMAQFNKICPLLKNVSILNVEGIGNTICFDRLQMPPLPVVGRWTIELGKEIFTELGGFFGGINPDKKNTELANLLTFCIYSIGKSSLRLETIYANGTNIYIQNIAQILKIPTLKSVEIAHCKKFYGQREVAELYELSKKFPNVKLGLVSKTSP